jgi:hypothetical protein
VRGHYFEYDTLLLIDLIGEEEVSLLRAAQRQKQAVEREA